MQQATESTALVVSAYTVQLWELILQFDEEVRWIWPYVCSLQLLLSPLKRLQLRQTTQTVMGEVDLSNQSIWGCCFSRVRYYVSVCELEEHTLSLRTTSAHFCTMPLTFNITTCLPLNVVRGQHCNC